MSLLDQLNLTIQKDLLLFFFDQKRRFVDRFAIRCNLLILLFIGCFRVGFAVEYHLRPNTVRLEHIQNFSKHGWLLILGRWTHECPILYAILTEKFLLLFRDAERSDDSFVFQFKRSLGCPILHQTQNLHVQDSLFYFATVSANLLVGSVCATNITL